MRTIGKLLAMCAYDLAITRVSGVECLVVWQICTISIITNPGGIPGFFQWRKILILRQPQQRCRLVDSGIRACGQNASSEERYFTQYLWVPRIACQLAVILGKVTSPGLIYQTTYLMTQQKCLSVVYQFQQTELLCCLRILRPVRAGSLFQPLITILRKYSLIQGLLFRLWYFLNSAVCLLYVQIANQKKPSLAQPVSLAFF